MSAITTYAKPKDNFLTIRIPNGYDTCSFKVVLFPIEDIFPLDIRKLGVAAQNDSSQFSNACMRKANEDLKGLAGTWVADPEAERVFDEMRTVDEELWQ